jgi:hypothetical protein
MKAYSDPVYEVDEYTSTAGIFEAGTPLRKSSVLVTSPSMILTFVGYTKDTHPTFGIGFFGVNLIVY